MNSRERWRALRRRQSVDRAPCDIWATPEVFELLGQRLGCGDKWQVIDKLEIDAPYEIETPYVGPELPPDTNYWGVRLRTVPYGAGTYDEAVNHPLAACTTVEEFAQHPWPRAEWFDYSTVAQQVARHGQRPLRAVVVEPFLWYCQLRGMEQAMMDLALAPELVEYAFDRIFAWGAERLRRIWDASGGQIDITVPAEDLGAQTGPLFSVAHFRRYHYPRFQRYIGGAKQLSDMAIFYHTDGASRPFIPDLIDVGVEILNPIQWRCPGMEREALKRDFGDRLIFHGGVENQEILPFGTPADVRAEVTRCYETLGQGGGYICASCHNLQPITPMDNILAMYDTIHELSVDPRFRP